MKKFLTTFLVVVFSMITIASQAEDQQPEPKPTTKPIRVYKKKPIASDIKRQPGMFQLLECSIGNDEISFVPSFWGEGMSVKITDEVGNEWCDFVTPEEPSMFFDGEIGNYEIECLTLEGVTFFGEFDL